VFYNQLTGARSHDVKTGLKKVVTNAALTGKTWHTFAARLIAKGTDIVSSSRQTAKRNAVESLSGKV
jgi:hypothetical protein